MTRLLTRGGTFEVWFEWPALWPITHPRRYLPTLHYRRDRIGD